MRFLKYFALFVCFFAFSEDVSDRVVDLQSTDQELIKTYYGGVYHYPLYCTLYHCPVCTYCGGINVNISLPFVPFHFLYNLELAHRQMCAHQYNICLWNSHPYYAHACHRYYFQCVGYRWH